MKLTARASDQTGPGRGRRNSRYQGYNYNAVIPHVAPPPSPLSLHHAGYQLFPEIKYISCFTSTLRRIKFKENNKVSPGPNKPIAISRIQPNEINLSASL